MRTGLGWLSPATVIGLCDAWTWFHGLILRANAVTPPRLEAWPIALWVGAELLVALVFAVHLHRTVTRR